MRNVKVLKHDAIKTRDDNKVAPILFAMYSRTRKENSIKWSIVKRNITDNFFKYCFVFNPFRNRKRDSRRYSLFSAEIFYLLTSPHVQP